MAKESSKNVVVKTEKNVPTKKVDKPAENGGIFSKYAPYLINFWIFIPAVIYFVLVNKYAVNIPYQDDYNAILEFLTKFKASSGLDKIALLFSQHADHRIFHSRIIYVLYYYIFGKINFIHIIFLANLQLVVIFILLVYFIKKAIPRYWNLVSLAVGFCLFDPASYENADFAMCGIQNYGVLMLFLLSLYFFSLSRRKNIFWGGLLEAICIFSSGNGLICAICITAYLILNRDKIKAIVSGGVFVVFTALYYIHYAKANDMGEVSDIFSSLRDTRFFLHMLGSHFSYEYGIQAGICLLIVLIVSFPFNFKLKFKADTLPFVCILAAMLGTVFTISIFRSGAGEIASYWSRYMIYSHLMVAVAFIFVWIKLDRQKIHPYIVSIAGLVLLFAYKGNYEYGEGCLELTKRRLESYPYYYGNHKPADNMTAKTIEEAACKENIYCIQDER